MMITIKQRVVDRLLGIRGIKEYHIFADGIDDYNHDYKAAVRTVVFSPEGLPTKLSDGHPFRFFKDNRSKTYASCPIRI